MLSQRVLVIQREIKTLSLFTQIQCSNRDCSWQLRTCDQCLNQVNTTFFSWKMQSKSRTKGSIRCFPLIRTKQSKKKNKHNTKTPVQGKYEAGTAGCRHIPCFKENKHFLTGDSQVSFPIVYLDTSSTLIFLKSSHTIFIITSVSDLK